MWFIDLMLAFSRWLESTPLAGFSVWMAATPISTAINQNAFATPITESVHILAIATAFGAAMMINLRILGVASRRQSILQVEERFAPWIWWSLIILVISGVIFVVAEPARELLSGWFWTKMGLIILAALANLWFQSSVRHGSALWEPGHQSAALRVGAAALIGLWLVIIIFGRLIAYTGVA
jgi:uncharacterized membrane protein